MNFNYIYLVKNFKKLEYFFYKILTDNKATNTTYCISIMQFIKPHPEYFIKYNFFINKSLYLIFKLFIFSLLDKLFRFTKWLIRKLEDFYLSFFLKSTNNLDTKNSDIIFITNVVTAKNLKFRKNINNDFVFGNIISHLRNIYNVKVFYINNTTINSRRIFENFKTNRSILILKKILKFSEEILILLSQFKELKNLTINFFFKKINFYESLLILNDLFSYETRNNIRLKIQFEKLLKIYSPKIVVTSFEGYCWEKIVFNLCKSINGIDIKTIGYQNAGIIKNQVSICRKYKKNYNPDYILTSGNINLSFFYKFFPKKKRLFEVGSNRSSTNNKNKILNKFLYNKKNITNCLVIPEGTNEETKSLFDFSYSLAKSFPKLNFILRVHPQVNLNKFTKKFFIFNKYKYLKNITFSNNLFNDDLKKSQIILYRGSTGVVTGVLNGLFPIYYRQPKESINIDPIFKLKKLRQVISDEKDLSKILNTFFTISAKDIEIGIIFCKKYFTNLEFNKTKSIFDYIIKK
jgi:hypothetical protein